jgi:hypothetical protein
VCKKRSEILSHVCVDVPERRGGVRVQEEGVGEGVITLSLWFLSRIALIVVREKKYLRTSPDLFLVYLPVRRRKL